jgi:hypothetical protein
MVEITADEEFLGTTLDRRLTANVFSKMLLNIFVAVPGSFRSDTLQLLTMNGYRWFIDDHSSLNVVSTASRSLGPREKRALVGVQQAS